MGTLETWDRHLNRHGKGLLGLLNTKFQASKPSGSEEEDFINIFLCMSMVRTYDRRTQGHLGHWVLHLNILGKELLGYATYQISNIWAQWFLRRRFLIYFYAFLWFYVRTLWRGTWDLGLNKLSKESPGNATY